MEDYNQKVISDGNLAKIVFILSFSIGTLILALFKITRHETFIVIGFYYVIAAFFFNFILFVNLVYDLIVYKTMQIFLLKHILLLLINIPIALFYLYSVFKSFTNQLFNF